MKAAQYIRRRQYRMISGEDENQSGINMADLMMWLVIAALIIAAALQALGTFQKGAYIYQMKNDLRGAVSLANTNGSYTGNIEEPQVAQAVASSNKSEGITMTWGVALDPTAIASGHQDTPYALGGSNISRVSFATSALPASVSSIIREGRSSYILIAHHDKVPDISVVYFFNDVSPYYTGTAVIADEDDFEIIGGTAAVAPKPEDQDEVVPPVAAAPPTSSPTSSPSATPSAPATTAPPVVVTQPSGTPAIPAMNKDPKTKKFMFCHNGMMHSNSFNGMVNGHENHPQDIMPPIPPLNYAGNNWNASTAKVFYNNCNAVPAS